MRDYGGNERKELEEWCNKDPINRRWGNMGYVECKLDKDAIEFITEWGINHHRRKSSIKTELGYSRIGLNNI